MKCSYEYQIIQESFGQHKDYKRKNLYTMDIFFTVKEVVW